MELASVLLLLSSLWGCSGHPAHRLVVTPREPLVPFGGSTELNCSLACAGGKVEWRGLDTALGTISSFSTHSILHIRNAIVATEGMKICQGSCHGQHYQNTVTLKVYALPDTLRLEAAPHILRPGHPANLKCSATHLYPISGVALTWYWGHHVVEDTDFDYEETDEELYNIISTLSVSGTEVAEGVEFRCEVTLHVRQETFTRVASLVASAEAVLEQPAAVVTSMGNPSTAKPVATTALPPGPSVPPGDPTTAWKTNTETTLDLAAVTNAPSTEPSVLQDLMAGSSTVPVATGAVGTEPPMGTNPACSLQIWSLPPSGTRGRALRIECHAQCSGNATVGWLRTPAALSQYREESAGSSSALRLDRAEPWHQGHYQCVLLGRPAQMVSLEVMVLDDSFSSSPAIAMGTAGSLLGLILTGAVSRRLWKRFRSRKQLS
ncbi:mucosal addressin cell adhesion molecule 1 isoform X2 [Cyanistes caeruleus]|uniref:mucosal addressin cell adhesion molecule 1 isoform X2 n=1 Tax=Cyanistes caeruleus TaxID=156563 RepID=UPI000CDAB11A|nr:mucosal addressin cell adhesion molecule 1 isoform X2 [Cyanistes caeruleus]